MNFDRRACFYFVARFGGVREAIRAKGLNIEDGAVRAQIRALEDELGSPLFHRRPMRLTSLGREYYHAIQPLMTRIEQWEQALPRRSGGTLRLGVDGFLNLCIAPAVVAWCTANPDAQVALIQMPYGLDREAVESGKVDVGVASIGPLVPRALASREISRCPIVLLLPADSDLPSADHFWAQRCISDRLITPPANHPITEAFDRGLDAGGITWLLRTEVDSYEAMVSLVASGHGVGVALGAPSGRSTASEGRDSISSARVRVLPLPGFDPVTVAALWRPADSRRFQRITTHLGC